ncbi:MAG: hypothetical protein M1824_001855 [Vezdaea acicularis]|nr:MAG: hypothetical protein M1824_001855 [Vezdaea acicularis]
MAEPGQEKDHAKTIGDVAAGGLSTDGPHIATEPLRYVGTDSSSSVVDAELGDLEKKGESLPRRVVTQSSFATEDASRFDSREDDGASGGKKKKWYKRLNPLKWGEKPPVPEERTVSREYGASFLSMLTFQWMAPIMRTGYRRPLELNDIWLVNPDRRAEIMAEKLSASFSTRVARGDKYPLLMALHETYKREFWIGGLCQFTSSILQVLSPFTLRYLIQFAGEAYYAQQLRTKGPPIGRGIGLVIAVTVMQMIQSLGTSHFIYRGMMVGAQCRAVLISVVFQKAMKISGRAKAGGKAIEGPAGATTVEDEKIGKEGGKAKKSNGHAQRSTPDKTPGVIGEGLGWGNGRIVTLMSVDTYRVDQASGMFHIIWTAPVSICLTLALLLVNLTYSALAGFGLLVLGIPLLTMAVKSLFVRRRAINKITDQRVSLTQEILQAVRFVKLFGWEEAFLERIGDIRKREVRSIQILLAIRNAVNAVSMSLPIFASMLSFITYSLSKHILDPAPIFSSLALFNSLRMPLNLLPMVIGQVIDAWASLGRIQDFLIAEELEEDAIRDYDSENAVEMRHANFTWERTVTQDLEKGKPGQKPATKKQNKDGKKVQKEEAAASGSGSGEGDSSDTSSTHSEQEPFKLSDINFTAGRNELLAVIGNVGSGKSSLLAALAGDMRKTQGLVMIGASRAFCPQYAWIQNTTVRENIVFGKEFDPVYYNKVIDACALRPDLEILPNGDQTEIGERGITVSGGQKQRINIARAIYFNADIVLMDDPLSAVDAHVGRHMFDNAISGLLKDKCRILATHQLHILNRCDRVIWMDNGSILAIDTFDNLMANNPGFQKLMVTTAQEKAGDEETDKNDETRDEEKKGRKKRSKPAAALMQAEERAVKSVSWGVYKSYIASSGSLLNAPLVIMLLILSQGANIATSLWLSWWTSNKFGFSMGQYIGAYAGLGVVQALMMFIFSVALTVTGTQASKVMLGKAMKRALRAPMSFFDTTPLGRITNRFSKDVDTMDNTLTDAMRMYFFTLSMIISVFILIIVYFHYFAIALGPLFIMFVFSASYYRASAREMKRHEAVLRSHVFSKFGEALSGTASIRAYGLQTRFVKTLYESIDNMDSAYYLTFSNQRWLSLRLDVIGNSLVFTTGILVVTSRFNVSPSIGGLVLSYILSIVQLIQFTVRQLAEVENAMNATERIHFYGTELEEEAPRHLNPVEPSWPEAGEIVFDHVQMRYRANLPLVLNDLSLHVKPGERVGVVGRTGAGKSSIMSTLFRLVEISSGSITIDGLDISKVGLHDLRTRLAIIPQDPTLFRGTIRSNLDPFNEHTDLELWSVLRQSYLVSEDANLDDKTPGRIHLDGVVEEEGLNYSLGQRQLMALARALVRGSRIIVCDEATSSVDMETDQKIQETMARGFKGKTLLCIAHRLRTILGYDRIVVMDKGNIAEVDTPLALWELGGVFRSMCDRSGIRREDFEEGSLE